ncbi:MAG: ABC transporter permease [Bacillota bacterium]|nr:ABC transporter permease [Bacillota bacterium]
MTRYIVKRLIISVFTILTILLVLFLMLELMPGTPFNDEKLTPEQKEIIYEKYGLDKPVMVRFANYITLMSKGDFGVSYNVMKNMPIAKMLKPRIAITVRLGIQAVILGTVIGLFLGVLAAIKHNTVWDTLTSIIAVIGVSVPSYVFALILAYLVGFKLQWLPISFDTAMQFESTILPTIALSMFTIATVSRFLRSEMLEVLSSEYILLARAKGLRERKIISRHSMRNALIPVITVLGPLVVSLMTGSLVIEKIFAIPGLGSLFVKAIQVNDYNLVIAIAFIYSLLFIFVMLIIDILYGIIDPRIRLGKEAN